MNKESWDEMMECVSEALETLSHAVGIAHEIDLDSYNFNMRLNLWKALEHLEVVSQALEPDFDAAGEIELEDMLADMYADRLREYEDGIRAKMNYYQRKAVEGRFALVRWEDVFYAKSKERRLNVPSVDTVRLLGEFVNEQLTDAERAFNLITWLLYDPQHELEWLNSGKIHVRIDVHPSLMIPEYADRAHHLDAIIWAEGGDPNRGSRVKLVAKYTIHHVKRDKPVLLHDDPFDPADRRSWPAWFIDMISVPEWRDRINEH